MGFALWALRARRPLFARDEVIAGIMAVAFTGVFVAGALATVVMTGAAAAYGALLTGTGMLAIAVWRLVKAQRRFARLAVRRAELERVLA